MIGREIKRGNEREEESTNLHFMFVCLRERERERAPLHGYHNAK